jgi:hypothetical protein
MKTRTMLAGLLITLLACAGCQREQPASSAAWPANPSPDQKAQLAKNLDDIESISAKYQAEAAASSAKDQERLRKISQGQ